MTQATQSGENWTVDFQYDALGRMLRREKSGSTSDDSVTYDYWLGLNKIAQEIGGTGAAVCIPDDEVNSTPVGNGWNPRSNGAPTQTIAYVTDSERGNVLHLQANTTSGTANYMIGDSSTWNSNPSDLPFNTGHDVISMWVRGNGSYSYSIAVLATTNLTTRWLYLSASDGADYKYTPPSTSYVFRIGMAYRAAQWQYLEIDLQERITDMEPGETLLHVDAIVPMVYDLKIDDIKLSEGRLNRSWAQVPGAALGGYLGAQTGADGANGVDAWDKYYYHFSDLGTVMATTDDAGAMLGVYQPDFWGNYRETYGTRPDTMGLTSKFFDTDVQAYDFGARWYDSERGRWLSEEPMGIDGPNLYHYVFNNVTQSVDMDGNQRVPIGNFNGYQIWPTDDPPGLISKIGKMCGEKWKKYGGDNVKNVGNSKLHCFCGCLMASRIAALTNNSMLGAGIMSIIQIADTGYDILRDRDVYKIPEEQIDTLLGIKGAIAGGILGLSDKQCFDACTCD